MCICSDNTTEYYTGSNCSTVRPGTRPVPLLGFVGEANATSNGTNRPWVGIAPPQEYIYFQFMVPSTDFPLTLRVTSPNPAALPFITVVAAYASQYRRPSTSLVRADGSWCCGWVISRLGD